MYKDKDKQRETDRQRQKRRRDRIKAKGVTEPGCDEQGVTSLPVDKVGDVHVKYPYRDNRPKRGKDIKCFADLPADVQQTINLMSESNEEKQKRTAAAIKYQHLFPNRFGSTCAAYTVVVTGKPGDADYNGVCTPEWRAERGR